MKICAILSILVVFVLAYSNPAYGYVVTVEVEGVVSEFGVETWGGMALDGSVTAGTIMTGSVIYDSETPDQGWPDDYGYYSLISISMNIGNYTFIHDPEATEDAYFGISVGGGGGWYKICSPSPLFYGPCWINGEPNNLEDLGLGPAGIKMYLDPSLDGVIVSDALPDADSFPELSLFDEERTFYVGNDGGLAFMIGGEITSITVIPEPGTLLLFGFGGLALLRKRRR